MDSAYQGAQGFAVLLTTKWGRGGDLNHSLVVGKKYPIRFAGMHKGRCIVEVPGKSASYGEVGGQWEVTSSWDI